MGRIHRSNLKSAELAAAAEVDSKNGEARDQRLHAMDYLEYAELQSGRVSKAKAVLDEMNALPPVSGLTLTGNYAAWRQFPRATRLNWEIGSRPSQLRVAEGGVPWAQAITWTAIGVGSARSKNPERAVQAEQKLADLRDAIAKQNNSYWSNQVEVAAPRSGRMDCGTEWQVRGCLETGAFGRGIGREHGQGSGHARGRHACAGDCWRNC